MPPPSSRGSVSDLKPVFRSLLHCFAVAARLVLDGLPTSHSVLRPFCPLHHQVTLLFLPSSQSSQPDVFFRSSARVDHRRAMGLPISKVRRLSIHSNLWSSTSLIFFLQPGPSLISKRCQRDHAPRVAVASEPVDRLCCLFPSNWIRRISTGL